MRRALLSLAVLLFTALPLRAQTADGVVAPFDVPRPGIHTVNVWM